MSGSVLKSSRWNISASVTAMTAPVLTEKNAVAGPDIFCVAMRTKIWFDPNPKAAQKAKTIPSSNQLYP